MTDRAIIAAFSQDPVKWALAFVLVALAIVLLTAAAHIPYWAKTGHDWKLGEVVGNSVRYGEFDDRDEPAEVAS